MFAMFSYFFLQTIHLPMWEISFNKQSFVWELKAVKTLYVMRFVGLSTCLSHRMANIPFYIFSLFSLLSVITLFERQVPNPSLAEVLILLRLPRRSVCVCAALFEVASKHCAKNTINTFQAACIFFSLCVFASESVLAVPHSSENLFLRALMLLFISECFAHPILMVLILPFFPSSPCKMLGKCQRFHVAFSEHRDNIYFQFSFLFLNAALCFPLVEVILTFRS